MAEAPRKRSRDPPAIIELIRRQFAIDDAAASCTRCGSVLECKKASNLKRHLLQSHPEVVQGIAEDSIVSPRPRKTRKIVVELDEITFFESCVKMTTVGGLPLNVFDSPGLVDVFSRIEHGLGVRHINRNNICDKIASVANQFRAFLTEEMKGIKVSLKMDEASRRGRSVLGVNVQYMIRKNIVVRTLGLVDLEVTHTAENIKKEVLKLIAEYGLSLGQIYSITTDNGANFVKAVELLRREIALYRETKAAEVLVQCEDGDESGDCEDLDEDYEDQPEDDHTDEDELEKACALLGGVRCTAHTLQLAVHDCIKECDLKKMLGNVRQAVKILRKFPFKSCFTKEGKKLPFLDCETRWNSSYMMVAFFTENEAYIREILKENKRETVISKSTWSFVTSFTEAFEPVFIATKKLQEETMTMGDFLFAWETCRLELRDLKNSMAACMMKHMERRRVKLFSPAVVAALYMDPRVNYSGSEFINDDDRKVAVDHLLKLGNSLEIDGRGNCKEVADKSYVAKDAKPTKEPSKIEKHLRQQTPLKAKDDLNVQQKLEQMTLQRRLDADENVLEYWEEKKKDEPHLYAISQVALAVPCTQVSVERAFNSLALILSDRRLRLSNENLTNILLIKLNAVLFDLINLKF